MKGPKIKGNRISLGPVKVSDAKTLVEFYNESSHLLGHPGRSMDLKEGRQFIRKQNTKESHFFFAIYLNRTEQIIGRASLSKINQTDGAAETLTQLGGKFTNKGYGTEAKHLLLDWAFNTEKLRKIYSKVLGYNPASRAYALKCGYKQEANLPKKKLYEGKYWNEWILAATKKSWEPTWEAYKNQHEID